MSSSQLTTMNEPGCLGHDCDAWFNTSKRLIKGVVIPSRAQRHNSRLLKYVAVLAKSFSFAFAIPNVDIFPLSLPMQFILGLRTEAQ